jgi:ubiquinone/menaquinone biosynthesis C-methylase UbiE
MKNGETEAAMPGSFFILHSLLRAYRCAVRRAFHHFYREFAWTYDAVAWLVSGGLWVHWIRAATPELRGRVLELGFGPGHLQLALAARPAVVGLDASPQMAAIAARRLRHSGAVPRLITGLAQRLPFPSESFDSVVATFPAEYMLDQATHAEIARVLAPGGRLIIVPLAQLEPSFYTWTIDLAYRLTLQAPVARADEPELANELPEIAGLSLRRHWLTVGPSRVLLLVGERGT